MLSGLVPKKKIDPFVVVGIGRDGSSYLFDLIGSHPDLQLDMMKSEIFHSSRGLKKHPKDIIPLLPCFKMLAYQDYELNISPYLKEYKYKVIFLERQNKLKQYISYCIASQKDVWMKELSTEKVTVNLGKMYEFLRSYREQYRRNEDRLNMLPCLKVYYEQLQGQRKLTLNLIYEFLSLSYHEPTTVLQKQETRDLSDIIINYDEVSESLKNGPLSLYLD